MMIKDAVLVAGCVVLVGGSTGCRSGERGPAVEAAEVVGSVRHQGRGISPGWIEFSPIDGAVGSMRSSPLGADGSFQVGFLGVGRYRIGLLGVGAKFAGFGNRFDTWRTPIQRTLKAGQNTLALDLGVEAIEADAELRGQADQAR